MRASKTEILLALLEYRDWQGRQTRTSEQAESLAVEDVGLWVGMMGREALRESMMAGL